MLACKPNIYYPFEDQTTISAMSNFAMVTTIAYVLPLVQPATIPNGQPCYCWWFTCLHLLQRRGSPAYTRPSTSTKIAITIATIPFPRCYFCGLHQGPPTTLEFGPSTRGHPLLVGHSSNFDKSSNVLAKSARKRSLPYACVGSGPSRSHTSFPSFP